MGHSSIIHGLQAAIYRGGGITELWAADHLGHYPKYPNMRWERELSDHECTSMVSNPWQIFSKPEPDGRVMARSDPA